METKEIQEIRIADIAPTKFGIELQADAIAEQVTGGNIDPLQVMVMMSALEQLTKAVKERIIDIGKDELYKHSKQTAEIAGAKLQAVDLPKYDYSHVPEWQDLTNVITEYTQRRKEIEEEEKKYRRGELPIISVTSSLKVNLSK